MKSAISFIFLGICLMVTVVIVIVAASERVKQSSKAKNEFNSLANWSNGPARKWNDALEDAPFSGVVIDRKVLPIFKERTSSAVYIQIRRKDGTIHLIYDMSASQAQIEATKRLVPEKVYSCPDVLK